MLAVTLVGDVGLSILLKSKLNLPVLEKGLGKVFGRILGETWFCSCLNIDEMQENRIEIERKRPILILLVKAKE